MRKILMASVALLGGSAVAHAQVAAPSQGQLVAPYGSGPATNNNNNAWGVANTPSGSVAAGPLSSEYSPNVIAVPAPGTVVIHLNGRVEVDATANYTSVDKGLAVPTAPGVTPVVKPGTPNGFKLNPVGIGSFFRLYSGFDGLSLSGIRYGASVELRENFPSGTVNAAGATAASPSGNSSGETIFVRRAFTYLASDKVGLIRLGQGDGVIGLFDNCIFTSQCWDAGDGGLDAGGSQQDQPGNVSPPFVWLSQVGAEYANSKIVYLSPQYYGFDFGLQYAPNQGNAFSNASGGTPFQNAVCGQASANCLNLSSGNDPTRWLNQVAAGLRYQRTFGAVDFKTYGFWETAGKESPTAITILKTSPAAGTGQIRYDNLNFYKAGVAVTALNTTLAVDYIGGAINGQLNERPTGGVAMNAVTAGLTYFSGPITLGLEYGIIDSQGQANLAGTSQRHEWEIAFGGNYKLAPGVQLVAEYQYAQRHQGDFDFTTGTVGNTRDAKYQGVTFATILTW
jgi:predicted porin